MKSPRVPGIENWQVAMDEQSSTTLKKRKVRQNVESCSCHGESRTDIEVYGQQYHAVHSLRTRTDTHKSTRRSTVRGRHKGKSLKRGCCAVAAAARDENEKITW